MKNFKLINPINKKELKKEYNKYVDKDGNSFLIISDIPRINKLKHTEILDINGINFLKLNY